MEANGASSKKDFKNKICICKKESQETKHWLRIDRSIPSGKKRRNQKAMARGARINNDLPKNNQFGPERELNHND
jgi:four helix bundle protein